MILHHSEACKGDIQPLVGPDLLCSVLHCNVGEGENGDGRHNDRRNNDVSELLEDIQLGRLVLVGELLHGVDEGLED